MGKRLSGLLLMLGLSFLSSAAMAVDESELLTAKQAFPVSVTLENNDVLLIQWDIAEGYYLYKKRLKFSFDQGSDIRLGEPVFPPSMGLNDPSYGDVQVFRNNLLVKYPIQGYTPSAKNAVLKLQYQGCADVGVCYPPIKKSINLHNQGLVSRVSRSGPTNSVGPSAAGRGDNAVVLSEQDSIAASLISGNFFLTLLSFFGFGLLLAFTPCVFPMIPILSGIIVGQGETISTRRAFSLSLAYVLSMALAYTVVGVLAAVFGTNLQIWFQNPWVLSSFAGIFVLLSFSMFGFYELQMPSSIQTKLNAISNRQEGGKIASAAIMGLLSALIVGPCVTAPLVGALIYIGQTGDVLLGGTALFALGLGMGAPLLVIGTSAGKLLPRAGQWMEAVKAVFGVLMLAVAIWLLDRVIPALVSQLLWATLLIVSGVYLGALRQHTKETSQWQLLWKSFGFVSLLSGSLMMAGVASGKGNLLHPLESFINQGGSASNAYTHKGISFQHIKELLELESELEKAQRNGQTVMLDFYADWCISCVEMEESTFTDAAVLSALSNTVTLQADVTKNDEIDQALLQHFGIIGPPAILLFDLNGAERKSFRVVGYTPGDVFSEHLKKAFQ